MTFKRSFSTSVILLSLTVNSWGQSCPLTNSKLTDIRTAASQLSTTIKLSSSCAAYEDTVNSANAEIQNIATQISTLNEEAPETERTNLAMSAITQLNTVSSVFNDKKCGKELANFLDYADAFVDVVNGMVPFLALYGDSAAMPWVMGSAVAGAVTKSVITFFQSKNINMRDPEQNNNFIKNSCSFYNLDLVKTSIDDLQLRQTPKLEQEIERARERLKEHEANEPAKPQSDTLAKLTEAKKDQEQLKLLEQQLSFDHMEACAYVSAYASQLDGGTSSLISRTWSNYEAATPQSFQLELERNYFWQQLNKSAQGMAANDCKELSPRWIKKVAQLNTRAIDYLTELNSKESSQISYATWLEEKNKLTENLNVLEAKMKFFQEMLSEGFNIEFSEIIRSHRDVQDTLFSSYKYLLVLKMKGLAQAWLQVKQEDSNLAYRSFLNRKKEVLNRINDIENILKKSEVTKNDIISFALNYSAANRGKEHPTVHKNTVIDVCNQLRLAWTSWYSGLIHARAGKDYCTSFDRIINANDYPVVHHMCFGTTDKKGKLVSSLKNQVTKLEEAQKEADELKDHMKRLSCEAPDELTKELLVSFKP